MLDKFFTLAFIWAYSLRAQYSRLGWNSAQNYILGSLAGQVYNSFNIYKIISEAYSPITLLNTLRERVTPVPDNLIVAKKDNLTANNEDNVNKIFYNYLHYFEKHKFIGK
jgi:hypothetical protein